MPALKMWLWLNDGGMAHAQRPALPSEGDVRVEWTLEQTNRRLWTLAQVTSRRGTWSSVSRGSGAGWKQTVLNDRGPLIEAGGSTMPIAKSGRLADVEMVECLENEGYAGRSVAPRPQL